MKNKAALRWALTAALLSFTRQAWPASGATLLKLEGSPAALALGQGAGALQAGVAAIGLNSAGLVRSGRSNRTELMALYSQNVAQSRLTSLAFAQQIPGVGAVGLSYLNLDAGALEGMDSSGQATGNFKAQDTLVGLHLGARAPLDWIDPDLPFRHAVSFGVGAKLLNSSIGAYRARATAFDLGAQYHNLGGDAGVPWSLGLAAQNLGGGLRYLEEADPLPTAYVGSAAVHPTSGLTLLGFAGRKVNDRVLEFGFGTQYALSSAVMLRARYILPSQTGNKTETANPLSNLGFGMGLKVGLVQLDYGFLAAQNQSLGATHKLAVTLAFGSDNKTAAPAPRKRVRSPWVY